ncbi:MAG: hypothetical protein ACLRXC_12905 [[Clostridium] leptum]
MEKSNPWRISFHPNAKAEVIDARGGWILPGLIEAHCHIGITEERKVLKGMTAMKSTNR